MQDKLSKPKLPQQIVYGGMLSALLMFGPKWSGFWAFTQAIGQQQSCEFPHTLHPMPAPQTS